MPNIDDVVKPKLPKLNPIVIPNTSERPPLLKKSRTISATAVIDPPHFPGPLFPTVRRLTTSPSSSWSTRSFDSSSSSSVTDHPFGTTTHFSDSSSFNFSDRDYVYPSFLGASTVRSRVTVKSNSKSQQPRPIDLSLSPAQQVKQSTADHFRGKESQDSGVRSSPVTRQNSDASEYELESGKVEAKLETENKLVPPVQIPARSLSTSSLNSAAIPNARRSFSQIKSLGMLNLVSYPY